MATTPTTATVENASTALGLAIVNAIKNVIGGDWAAIQQETTAAAKTLASVSINVADPTNAMTRDEKQEILDDYKDSLKNSILYGEVVADVVVNQAIDAVVQAIVTALPALIGTA